ncbi:hypothetical protein T11_9242 [Trichinella zimbabwensis]|uniref:Uncharacterized protein n=1 Tax=Trichinella zimbabwensis TaxID=268475 RepID=A0A0V1I4W8_9BILA|nr:hypothetical protein T11_9242 [Trichinella zimbabwensis]
MTKRCMIWRAFTCHRGKAILHSTFHIQSFPFRYKIKMEIFISNIINSFDSLLYESRELLQLYDGNVGAQQSYNRRQSCIQFRSCHETFENICILLCQSKSADKLETIIIMFSFDRSISDLNEYVFNYQLFGLLEKKVYA